MIKIYVYSLEDYTHVATIIGADNEACEAKATEVYGSDSYGATYSPAFGFKGGLVKAEGVEVIEA